MSRDSGALAGWNTTCCRKALYRLRHNHQFPRGMSMKQPEHRGLMDYHNAA